MTLGGVNGQQNSFYYKMYSLAIYLMMLGCNIAALFNKKVRTMMRGHRDTWRILRRQIGTSRYVWFHAASLGEFEQGRPLMERLRREHPERKILLTFSRPRAMRCARTMMGPM